jgi:hypothetical protein
MSQNVIDLQVAWNLNEVERLALEVRRLQAYTDLYPY